MVWRMSEMRKKNKMISKENQMCLKMLSTNTLWRFCPKKRNLTMKLL
jgi:hypothetical protein